MNTVLVLAEHRQGTIRDITFEMLAVAQNLATPLGSEVALLLLGSGLDSMTRDLTQFGVKVMVVDDPSLEHYNPETQQKILSSLIDLISPAVFMAGHTAQGVDMLPALAIEKNLPFIPDIVGAKVEDGVLKVVRQLYQGKIDAHFSFKPAKTYMVSIREGTFEAPAASSEGPVEALSLPLTGSEEGRRFIQYVEAEVGDVDITQSDILVAIGRGLREDKNMPLIEEFAKALQADLCGSRAAIDAGWLSHDRQVGTSGKTVKPKLYIALGISGSFQHVAGIKGAKVVVSINKDADAPIFSVSDYAIVDDLLKVIPGLTEKIRELKG